MNAMQRVEMLKGVYPLVRWSLNQSIAVTPKRICSPKICFRCHSLNLNQDLPSLPVAPLQQSLKKYLASVRPLLSDEEFAKTSRLVEVFGAPGGQGEKLHAIITEKAKNEVNWMEHWWHRYGYAKWRDPVVVNSSPGLLLPKQDFGGRLGQIRFASRLLCGILDYKKLVDSGKLPAQFYGKDPICMKQNYRMLNSCRIPGVEEDDIFVHPPENPESKAKYIVVVHNNQFFIVNLYDDVGNQLNLSQIQDQLNQVIAMSPSPGPPVGMLTAMDRDSWGKTYEKLVKDPTNQASVDKIQKSILVLCLDQPSLHLFPTSMHGMAANMQHGSGSNLHSGNRWFDKVVQVVVSTDGAVGATYEHMLAEAPALYDIFDHAFTHLDQRISTRSLPEARTIAPEKLEFNLTDVAKDLNVAIKQVDRLVNNVELSPRVFKKYGKDFIKHHKMSPDAYLQVCYQLAYYRMHGHPTATYETGSTKKFKYARTETVRSCSMEAFEFSKAMDKKTVGRDEKLDLLQKATQKHSTLTKEAMGGEGIDRIFLGMKLAAMENGLDVPEIYTDPAYQEHMRLRLSTSQVPMKFEGTIYFGPSQPDGYGLCYNPMSDRLVFTVSAFKDCEITCAEKFADLVEATLKDVHLLLLGKKSN